MASRVSRVERVAGAHASVRLCDCELAKRACKLTRSHAHRWRTLLMSWAFSLVLDYFLFDLVKVALYVATGPVALNKLPPGPCRTLVKRLVRPLHYVLQSLM